MTFRRPHAKPNVALIVMDATRPDHLSCYGYSTETTPNLTALATEATLFENAISPAPWTLPSLASLFTGTYPCRHGARTWRTAVDNTLPTLAEMLAGHGYVTAAYHAAGYLSSAWRTDKGFQVIRARVFPDGTVRELLEHASARVQAMLTNTNDCGARWINSQADRFIAASPGPFFLYVHYMEPHAKYQSPWPYCWRYLDGPRHWVRGLRVNREKMWLDVLVGREVLEPTDFHILASLYDGALAYLDHRIGELVGALRRRGLLDNTILIITADHGENLGDHGLMGHQWCLYESLIRVPLLIRYPGVFAAGDRISNLVQTMDILPTVLDVLELTPRAPIRHVQGQSFIAEGRVSPRRDYAFAEDSASGIRACSKRYPQFDFSPFDRQLRAVRTDRYKYIWSSKGDHQLFDLQNDPSESRNVAAERPRVVSRLSDVLHHWHASSQAPTPDSSVAALDPAVERRLRGLGYLG